MDDETWGWFDRSERWRTYWYRYVLFSFCWHEKYRPDVFVRDLVLDPLPERRIGFDIEGFEMFLAHLCMCRLMILVGRLPCTVPGSLYINWNVFASASSIIPWICCFLSDGYMQDVIVNLKVLDTLHRGFLCVQGADHHIFQLRCEVAAKAIWASWA